MNIIKIFRQVINKTTYNWNIEPEDRSWIITQDGEIKGGINHRTILKKSFTKEWDELKNTNKDDSEIEMLLVIFNLLFVLFPLAILAWYEDILNIISVSFLTSAFISMLFLVIVLFLFYLYTRLTADNLTSVTNITESPLSAYTPFIQLLSRRELEVIEAILAGNVRYKQLSAALNISVSTVKTHLLHIYQITGVSSVSALSSLFHGYTPQTSTNQP